jgi:hypothetical protein
MATTRKARRATTKKVAQHKKAAKKADRQADRHKAASEFWGGKDSASAKKRSGGKSLLARGARKTAIEQANKSVKKRLEAARERGKAKQTRGSK